MATPLVSVLMTAYNREKYIAEAIESVLASTFQDFELIIVDDCSRDHTVEIVRRYTSDPRLQVHVNEKNLGDYPNRNRAASFACGKYLKYLDSDDVIYPHGLEVMVSSMERFPDAVFGLMRPQRSDGPDPAQINPREAYVQHFLKGGFLDAGPSGTIIQTSAFRELGGFTGERFVGDTEMWLRLAARWPVVRLVQGLVWWRRHYQQEIVFERADVAVIVDRYLVSLEALGASECPLCPQKRKDVLAGLNRSHARSLLRLSLRQAKPVEAWRIMRESGFRLRQLPQAFSAPIRAQ
jgi:glycosyltransferase involved in cell wall biosynthesis